MSVCEKRTKEIYFCSINIEPRDPFPAAHCLVRGDNELKPDQLIISFGKQFRNIYINEIGMQKIEVSMECFNLLEFEFGLFARCLQMKLFQVQKLHVHPQYQNVLSGNDIAVIELSKDVQLSDFVRPICLPNRDEDVDFLNTKSIGFVS